MQANGLPFAVKFFLLLAIFALGFLLARDLFFIINRPSDQKGKTYAAAASSTAPTKTKRGISSSDAAPAADSAASKEPLRGKTDEGSTSLRQDPFKNLPENNPSEIGRPVELGNMPSKGNGPNAMSLRGDEGKSPLGDLRAGADAKPMGSLRGLTESSVTGSLRPDERSLPTGSLRSDEGSLPSGNLR